MNGYFEGWYYKQQNKDGAVALIPSLHRDASGKRQAFLQVITSDFSKAVPMHGYVFDRKRKVFILNGNVFTDRHVTLQHTAPGIRLSGRLVFAGQTKPKGDVMGPFQFMPLMQCRHSVFSMRHTVSGYLQINDKTYHFHKDPGYMEGDRGVSFPKAYGWAQGMQKNYSVFMSWAKIPFCGHAFNGVLAIVLLNGKELRFATYNGAKLIFADAQNIVLQKGPFLLSAKCLSPKAQTLLAPDHGGMRRKVSENVSCRTRFKLLYHGQKYLDFISSAAGFETGGTQPAYF